MKLIIDINENVYTRLFDNGIQDNEIAVDDVWEMVRALILGIPIPDNATNGEVMKIIFPKIGVYDEWYDEPYQKGGK